MSYQPQYLSYPQTGATGPPPSVPHATRPPPPPIPGNRPGAPTPMPVPQPPPANDGSYTMPTPAPNPSVPVHNPSFPALNPSVSVPPFPVSQAYQEDRILPVIPYNGLMVPNPRAPPLNYGVPKVHGYDPAPDAEAIRKACKGFGTDEAALIKILTKIPILKMDALTDYYVGKYGSRLVDVLDKETRSYFGMGIHALATGPLEWDIELLDEAVAGIGTNEDLLTEILLDRTSEDVYRLSVDFKHRYGVDLSVKVKDDLSGGAQKMFMSALDTRRPLDSAPVDPHAVGRDVQALYTAGQGRIGKDEGVFFDVLINRSRPHIAAVIHSYANTHRSLSKVIKSEFSGHVRSGLLFIVEGVKPKRDGRGVWRDAKLIHKSMKGFGTKDKQLVYRIIRAHWNPERMAEVKAAYHKYTGKTLEANVKSETSGDYKKLMVAIIDAGVKH